MLTRRSAVSAIVVLSSTLGCGGGSATPGGSGGISGHTGAGGNAGASGAAGMAGRGGPGGPGMAGSSGPTGGGGVGAGTGGIGGTSGVFTCTPGVEQTIITDCGYPDSSHNPLSSTTFNEDEVLRAIQPAGTWPNGVVRLFYNDEHAMTLGVRSVVVKTASGTTTTDYTVSPLPSDPGSVASPLTGTNVLAGDQNGLDASLRPMWPSLFITDVSVNTSSRAGDWQQGGAPRNPDAVFGTWKAAVRTVDDTKSPAAVTITPDADPAKNNWSLGTGADAVPSGLSNEGYGAEVSWNVTLQPGHSYRLQVIVHDGDQNKAGGDSGEACVLFCAGGSCSGEGCPGGGGGGAGGSCSGEGCGGSGGGVTCPEGSMSCGNGTTCPEGTVCANGCCLLSPG